MVAHEEHGEDAARYYANPGNVVGHIRAVVEPKPDRLRLSSKCLQPVEKHSIKHLQYTE